MGVFTSRLSEMAGQGLVSLSCPLKAHVFPQCQPRRSPQQVNWTCLGDFRGPCEAPGRARPRGSKSLSPLAIEGEMEVSLLAMPGLLCPHMATDHCSQNSGCILPASA